MNLLRNWNLEDANIYQNIDKNGDFVKTYIDYVAKSIIFDSMFFVLIF